MPSVVVPEGLFESMTGGNSSSQLCYLIGWIGNGYTGCYRDEFKLDIGKPKRDPQYSSIPVVDIGK